MKNILFIALLSFSAKVASADWVDTCEQKFQETTIEDYMRYETDACKRTRDNALSERSRISHLVWGREDIDQKYNQCMSEMPKRARLEASRAAASYCDDLLQREFGPGEF